MTEYEFEDGSMMDVEDLEAERDMQLAAVDAIRRARRFGTYYVIREDDEIKKIPPDKTQPYEDRLLASAARIDKRIAELQSTPTEQREMVLNEAPPPEQPQK